MTDRIAESRPVDVEADPEYHRHAGHDGTVPDCAYCDPDGIAEDQLRDQIMEALAARFTSAQGPRNPDWDDTEPDSDRNPYYRTVPMAVRAQQPPMIHFTAQDGTEAMRVPTIPEITDAVMPVIAGLIAGASRNATHVGALTKRLLDHAPGAVAEVLWPEMGDEGLEIAEHLAERPYLYLTCRRCQVTAAHCPCPYPLLDWSEIATDRWCQAHLGPVEEEPAPNSKLRQVAPELGVDIPAGDLTYEEWRQFHAAATGRDPGPEVADA